LAKTEFFFRPLNMSFRADGRTDGRQTKTYSCVSGENALTKQFIQVQTFERLQQLRTHKPKVKCKLCFVELHQTNLKAHVRKHERSSRQFVCDECLAKFSSKETLRKHLFRCRNIEQFSCTECHKRFYSREMLKVYY
jgi:uncharacterized Zn-finger protein